MNLFRVCPFRTFASVNKRHEWFCYVTLKNKYYGKECKREKPVCGEPTEDPAYEAANDFLLNQSLKEQEEEAELQAYLDRLQAEREKRENELLCPLDD